MFGDALNCCVFIRVEPNLQHLATWVAATDFDVRGDQLRSLVFFAGFGFVGDIGEPILKTLAQTQSGSNVTALVLRDGAGGCGIAGFAVVEFTGSSRRPHRVLKNRL